MSFLPRTSRRTLVASLAAAAVVATGAGAAALAGTGTPAAAPTTVTVTPAPTLKAGTVAPFSAPGVRSIRNGKAIPSGYVLVGYRVTVHKGAKTAGAALRFACPSGKTIRTFGTTGSAGFTAERTYEGHQTTYVTSTPDPRDTDSDGLVYAVCR